MPESHVHEFTGVWARQSADHQVVTFAATSEQIERIAAIDRISRDERGKLSGFQRSQIVSHIREIRDYFEQPQAVLPNPVVLAFTSGVATEQMEGGLARFRVDVGSGPPGLVVDGQQRLTALLESGRGDFQVFVAALVCRDEVELRRQFVLINNTRPLPKSLLYELLPTLPGLPARLSARAFAAKLTERLNYETGSAFAGRINMHTNPGGVIKDTAIQRVVMNSVADGALRELMHFPDGDDRSYELLNQYFWAVRDVFEEDWEGRTSRTSRLVHGAGIQAMGYVMEVLYSRDGSQRRAEFRSGLSCLAGRTAWTQGAWRYAENDIRPWNSIQNVNHRTRPPSNPPGQSGAGRWMRRPRQFGDELMENHSALVLRCGGQVSTTCLAAWALERYTTVATVAFDYGAP